MLPMLDLGQPKAGPNPSPVLGEGLEILEDGSWMLRRQNEPKAKKARENGVYTVGKVQFKIRKGSVIPAKAENIIYDSDRDTSQPPSASDSMTRRMRKTLPQKEEPKPSKKTSE
jgi:hypothetical protein